MALSYLKDKIILVTGACGTIGSELINQLLNVYEVGELVGLDNNESELFFMEQRYKNYPNANFFLTDVRDKDELSRKCLGIDILFHAAAYKHVVLCEKSPFEAVQTNILGVKNIIDAASECKVEKVIFTSSDKAVNPTNVMGTSKLMGERLITAANSSTRKGPVFASTRFGNVLGSRGSVIPIFREQIKEGKTVTLTDPEMTRFIMSISQATSQVIDSVQYAKGGEVFVTKMPIIRICDLAKVMIEELAPRYGHNPEDIEIDIVGSKPGEKLYEELMNFEETRRTVELENYFAILPAFRDLYKNISYKYPGTISTTIDRPYNSANEIALTPTELKHFLLNYGLLEEPKKTTINPYSKD
ncbi:Polysaccharide biosynthesis protein [Maridesulfovibrio ferrireducens]|uniref:Polysaccharide biosynthesis protein n=1 Tax=Maridesulfovibrio ferrireducens TaxID=246191 RepID=A0A1G9ERK3_9BACT|nr:polysaccharide biosynthesis protein [Maridesulfovibrio ferrireducens]SDK78724.1 Polysaccharide biosynthesis protein [Maridesulfovibrio ferrireducens]